MRLNNIGVLWTWLCYNYLKNYTNQLLENLKKEKFILDLKIILVIISKFNKGIRFLLCVINIFSKYAWVIPLKDKKGILNVFQKLSDKSVELHSKGRKRNKIWVDKGSEFYNNSFKKWLKDNYIEMYSIHNEEKSVVAERFIRKLKNKIYKYMTSISKNVYIDKLDDIVDEYNDTYHRTIKMLMLKIIHILIQWNCILKKKLMMEI